MIQGKRWNFLLIKHQVNSLKIKILKNFPFFFYLGEMILMVNFLKMTFLLFSIPKCLKIMILELYFFYFRFFL